MRTYKVTFKPLHWAVDDPHSTMALEEVEAADEVKAVERARVVWDTGATWSGSGFKQKWLTAALKDGKMLADFAN